MGEYLKKSKKSLSFFLVLISLLTFFSCSQSSPELALANYSVIFEYKNEDSKPDSRLSVYMESESDVHRYSRIRITSVETGYYWDFNDISKLSDGNKQWAGTTSLKAPENDIIPAGVYEADYFNADEKQTSVLMTVNYDSAYYDYSPEDIPELMKKKNGKSKIAIYNNNGILIYFGEKTSDLSTVRGIWNTFRDASVYQDIYCTPGNYIICIMPEQDVALNLEKEKGN